MKSLILCILAIAHVYAASYTTLTRLPAVEHDGVYVTYGNIVESNDMVYSCIASRTSISDPWTVAKVSDPYIIVGVRYLGDRFVAYGYEITTIGSTKRSIGRVFYSTSGRLATAKLDTSWHMSSKFSTYIMPFYDIRILPKSGIFIVQGHYKYDSVMAPDSHAYAYSVDSCKSWHAYSAIDGQAAWKEASTSWVAPAGIERSRVVTPRVHNIRVGCYDIRGRRVRNASASSFYVINGKKCHFMR